MAKPTEDQVREVVVSALIQIIHEPFYVARAQNAETHDACKLYNCLGLRSVARNNLANKINALVANAGWDFQPIGVNQLASSLTIQGLIKLVLKRSGVNS